MKKAFAIALLCIPGLLTARESCTWQNANRAVVAQVHDGKPALSWRQALLFEQQVL